MNDPAPIKIWNAYDRPHQDLREFLSRIERAGELLRVPGAHWNLEMGTLAEAVNERTNAPAVLFQDVVERTLRLALGGSWQLGGVSVTGNGGVHLVHNAGHVTGASKTQWVGSIGLTYRIHHQDVLP